MAIEADFQNTAFLRELSEPMNFALSAQAADVLLGW